jgi:epoxyqueuosine reductase
MGYLGEHVDVRLDPGRILRGAKSIVMVADLYATRNDGPDRAIGVREGRIARYARGRDYHKRMKKRLHATCDVLRERYPSEEFRAFTDTAPVLERELAQRAGLGWVGKHTLLIHPVRGSYFFLGGFATTLEVAGEATGARVVDHCGSCTRCIEACPTDAITPYSVDGSRCISYLTIERREPIDEAFHRAIGAWLFGCDVCQEVCPHNSPRGHGRVGIADEAYEPRRDGFDLLDVLGWDEADRRAAFEGTALKRATLAMMKRNAVIVAGNKLAEGEDADLRGRLEEIAGDESESDMVRDAAATVLARIEARNP